MVFQDSQAATVKRETPVPQVCTAPVPREREEAPVSLVLQDPWERQDPLGGPDETDCLDFQVKK